MNVTAHDLWLIPALPLAAAAITALLPRSKAGLSQVLAIGALVLSFVVSALALTHALREPATHEVSNFVWLSVNGTTLPLGFLLDPLTGFMVAMVTFVGTLIFIFSTAYLHDDPNVGRFFCFLSLFAAGMLGLLVANSLLLLFVCWEIVGLASYLLIGFWFQKPSAAAAAKKAFLTTRIGDIGFFLGLLWLQKSGAGLLFYDGGKGVLEAATLSHLLQLTAFGLPLVTVISLLLFCGAAGKSGQVPLQVWLPDAMEGPTPVSALIHAATMVAAGVFLMARVYPLLSADQAISHIGVHALTVIAFIGAITALYGAVVAVAQNDIKRVLAFSTVSQLGYMMLAIGVGSWVAAIFHLLTHAFFKALLFLGAGSVIHAAHHEQDIRKLGGLSTRLRLTFVTFAIGTLALQGVPLFAGFWSKESIVHAAHEWAPSHLPFAIALVGVVLTAFYMTRLVVEVFFGQKPRDPHVEHAHEGPAAMTLPLVLLAIGAVVTGFFGTPAYPWLQYKLQGLEVPEFELAKLHEGLALTLTSVACVAAGIGAGWLVYGKRPRVSAEAADPIEKAAPSLFSALADRLRIDELYGATVILAFKKVAGAALKLETRIIGASVGAIGALTKFLGFTSQDVDRDLWNAGFDAASDSLDGAASRYALAQNGRITLYIRILGAGFVALLLILTFGGLS